MSTEQKSPTKITVRGRLCFPHLYQPYGMNEGDKKKFQANIVFSKDDTAQIKKIEAATEAAKEIAKSKKWKGKIPKKLELNLLDGDMKENAGEEFNGMFYINPKSDTKPGTVKKDPSAPGGLAVISEDEKELYFYPGAYVIASVDFYGYENNGSCGISASLNHVLFWKHGERLAGRASADDDFADVLDEIEEEDDDLMG